MIKTTNEYSAGGCYLTFAETSAFSKASQEVLLEIIDYKGLQVITPGRREFTVDGIRGSANERYKHLNGEA